MSAPVTIVFKAVTDQAESGIAKLASSMEGAFRKFVSAAVVEEAIRRAINFGDEMGKAAQKIGVAVESLSTWTVGASLANVEAHELELSFRALANTLSEAADGQKEAKDLFQQLAVAISSSDGTVRSFDEILRDIADQFQRMPNGIEKSHLAAQLFGRSGQQLIPFLNDGAAGIERMREEAEELGVVIDRSFASQSEMFNDTVTKIGLALRGVAIDIARRLLPSLIAFAQAIKEITVGSRSLVPVLEPVVEVIRTLAGVVVTAQAGLQQLGVLSLAYANAAWERLKGNKAFADELIRTADAKIKEIEERSGKQIKSILGISEGGEDDDGKSERTRPDTKSAERIARELEKRKTSLLAEIEFEEQILDRDLEQKFINAYQYEEKRAELIRRRTAVEYRFSEKSAEDIRQLETKEKAALLENDRQYIERIKKQSDEAYDAQIAIAQAKGEKLIATELEIRKKFAAIRQSLDGSQINAGRLPGPAAIDAAERAELAQARVANEMERQERAQHEFQQSVQTTNALVESGQVSQLDGQERNNRAAEEYRRILLDVLKALEVVARVNPDLAELRDKLQKVKQEIAGADASIVDNSFLARLSKQIDQLKLQAQTAGRDIADGIMGPMRGALDNFGEMVLQNIEHTKSFAQAWAQAGRQVVANLITIAAKYVASKLAMMAVDTVFHNQSTRQAASTTASSGVAGVAKAGEQGGWYGVLIYLGVFAAAIAAVSAMAAGLSGGFAEGGFVKGPGSGTSDSILTRLSNGEFVVNAMQTEKWLPVLQAINDGAMNVGVSRPITSGDGAAKRLPGLAGATGGGSAVNVSPAPVKIAVVNDQSELRRFMESEEGRKIVFESVSQKKLELGL
jgi:hypothetical protein